MYKRINCIFIFFIFFLNFILTPFHVNAEPVPTIDKVKMMQEMKEAMKSEFNVKSIDAIKTVSSEAPVASQTAKGFFQATPPQLKLAVGVALVGCGIAYGTYKGEDVIQKCIDYLDPEEIKRQVTRDADGIIHISSDMINKIKQFSNDLKNDFTNNTDFTKDNVGNIEFTGFNDSHIYKGICTVYTPYGNLIGEYICTAYYPYGGFRTVFHQEVYEGKRRIGLRFYNGRNVQTGDVSFFDYSKGIPAAYYPFTVQWIDLTDSNKNFTPKYTLGSVSLVDGNFSAPSSTVIGTTGNVGVSIGQDLVISPTSDDDLKVSSEPTVFTNTDTNPGTEPSTGTKTATSEDVKNQTDSILDTGTKVNLDPLKVAGNTFTMKFPFSLPWDLMRSFTSLRVSSIKPNFDIDLSNLPISSICGLNKIQIDLTDYNELFALVKFFELLAFDIALILATRRLMGGSV